MEEIKAFFTVLKMAKVYCLVLRGGEYEDMELTLSLDNALEWLGKRQKTGQVIEYSVPENGISKEWCGIWYYDTDGNLQNDAYVKTER